MGYVIMVFNNFSQIQFAKPNEQSISENPCPRVCGKLIPVNGHFIKYVINIASYKIVHKYNFHINESWIILLLFQK